MKTSVQVPSLPTKTTDADVEEAFHRWEHSIEQALQSAKKLQETLNQVLSKETLDHGQANSDPR